MLTGTGSSATAKYTYGDNIEIKYTATVNENAVNVVSENYAELIYSNNPNDSTKTGKTPPEIEKVFSAKVKIEKVDGDTKQINPQTSAVSYSKHLKGAKFVLKCVSKADNASSSDAGKYYYYDSTNDTVTWVTVAAADQTAEKLKDNTDLTIAITDDDGFADDVFIGLENGQY